MRSNEELPVAISQSTCITTFVEYSLKKLIIDGIQTTPSYENQIVRTVLSDFLNRLFEFHCEENCSKRDGKYVRTRFRRIDGNRFVWAKHVRHKIDERQQQYKLTQHDHHNRRERVAERDKRERSGHLYTEQNHCAA